MIALVAKWLHNQWAKWMSEGKILQFGRSIDRSIRRRDNLGTYPLLCLEVGSSVREPEHLIITLIAAAKHILKRHPRWCGSRVSIPGSGSGGGLHREGGGGWRSSKNPRSIDRSIPFRCVLSLSLSCSCRDARRGSAGDAGLRRRDRRLVVEEEERCGGGRLLVVVHEDKRGREWGAVVWVGMVYEWKRLKRERCGVQAGVPHVGHRHNRPHEPNRNGTVLLSGLLIGELNLQIYF